MLPEAAELIAIDLGSPGNDCRAVGWKSRARILSAAGRLAPALALSLSLSLLLAPGCGNSRDSASAGGAGRSAAGDSAAAGATERAVVDSSAAGADSSKATGFFERLFHRRKPDRKPDEPVPVELAAAARRNLPDYLTATATLEPEKQAEVLAKIDGEIIGLHVEEGDRVRQGTVLAVLDGAAQRVALEEAEARVQALQLDRERVGSLYDEQLASEKDLHDAESSFAQAEAQRKAAQLRVDYTRVIAPFSGQIAERAVAVGQTVAVGARLFTIADTEPLLVAIHLPEREAIRIHAGQQVLVSPDTDPDLQAPGEVLRIAPVVDARTGTVKVTCQVRDADPRLRPGSFVRVRVETAVRADALCIPKRALISEGEENYVFRVVADSVVKVPIVTGHHNRTLVEVVEGLTPGERVVTVGHGALKTGSKFREVAAADTADAETAASAAER